MAIITRPIKTGGGTDYVAGNDELAAEFNADANTIYTDYNGNITDANCSLTMGLQGTKLADAPNGIPTAKINDLAVTTAKLNDGSVTAIKLGAGIVSTNKFKNLVIESVAFSYDFTVANIAVLASLYRFTSAPNYIGKVTAWGQIISSKSLINNILTITPTTPIPTATKDLIGLYLENIVVSGSVISGNVIFISVDKT